MKRRGQRLVALGLRGLPVVAKGEQAVYRVNLAAVAQLAGIPYSPVPALAPDALLSRAQTILDTALELTLQLEPFLDATVPGRDRSIASLATHIVTIGASCRPVEAGEPFTGDLAAAEVSPPLTLNRLRARRAELAVHFGECADPDRTVETYYGDQTLHAVLERVTWHMAHHTRQLQLMVRRLELVPHRPVTEAMLAGLPVPSGEWD